MFNKGKFLKDLEEIVNIDSGTYTPNGSAKIVNILSTKFHNIGFKTKIIDVGKEVGPLLIAYNKDDSYFDAMIVAHTDTVYAEGSVAKYKMRVEGNKIYGLGTVDMKAALLQGIYAVETLDKSILDNLSLCFFYNSDEEISSPYSKDYLIATAKKSKCAMVLESSDIENTLMNKRRAAARYKVSFHGKSAHASLPQEGISAIKELAHFILRLEEFNNPIVGNSFNVSPIKGGTVMNTIADYAELYIEIRFLLLQEYEKMNNKIAYFSNNPIIYGIKTIVKQLSKDPLMVNKAEHKWFEDMVMKAASNMGLKLNYTVGQSGSDGDQISEAGIPVIDGFGPFGGCPHIKDKEYLVLDSMEPRVILLQEVLKLLRYKDRYLGEKI